MKPLLILGTTPYALVFADAFSDQRDYEVVGFVENLDRARCAEPHGGLPVHWVEDIGEFSESHAVICCLSTTFRNRFVEPVKARGFEFATLVHPTAYVSRRTAVDEGTSLNVGSIVAGYSNLGRYVLVNRGVTIGHHTVLEDYVTVQPGVNIAGQCRIGAHTYIGIGATVRDGIRVGRHSLIGAGAVVTSDIPDHVVAMGVPAKVVRRDFAGQ